MTVIHLILLQLMAHFVADFLFQSESWCKIKEKHVFSIEHALHALIISIVAYFFSLDIYFGIPALIIGISHYFIDTIKSYYVKNNNDKKAIAFFTDQLLHIIILCLVSWAYFNYHKFKPVCNINLSIHSTAIITAFLFCTKPANIFIRNVFDSFNLNIPKVNSDSEDKATEQDLENAGKIIGIMERLMTLALIFSSQYAAVGLIIAAKSILRFNNQQKNEYILVGTLLSFGFAILIGVLINHLKLWVL